MALAYRVKLDRNNFTFQVWEDSIYIQKINTTMDKIVFVLTSFALLSGWVQYLWSQSQLVEQASARQARGEQPIPFVSRTKESDFLVGSSESLYLNPISLKKVVIYLLIITVNNQIAFSNSKCNSIWLINYNDKIYPATAT